MKIDDKKLTKFYSERSRWTNIKEESMRFEKAVKLANIKSNSRILDIGCRRCQLKDFIKTDIEYYGIDIASEFAKENVVIADVSYGIDYPKNFFDYVFCLEVLEHIRNPYYVLEEIYRVLKPDAFLILSVPNPYHVKEIIWNFLKIEDRQGHIFSFTRQITHQLLKFVGFRIKKTVGTYFFDSISCNNLMTRSFIHLAQKQ